MRKYRLYWKTTVSLTVPEPCTRYSLGGYKGEWARTDTTEAVFKKLRGCRFKKRLSEIDREELHLMLMKRETYPLLF